MSRADTDRLHVVTGGPGSGKTALIDALVAQGMRTVAEIGRAVVLDRGAPDVVGFLRASGLPVPAHIDAAARAHRYNPRVFLAPFWAEIYVRDPERRQPAERVRFVLARLDG